MYFGSNCVEPNQNDITAFCGDKIYSTVPLFDLSFRKSNGTVASTSDKETTTNTKYFITLCVVSELWRHSYLFIYTYFKSLQHHSFYVINYGATIKNNLLVIIVFNLKCFPDYKYCKQIVFEKPGNIS